MRKLLKTVNTFEDFHTDIYEKLSIGVEVQDFTEPNLIKEEKDIIINSYKDLFKNFTGIKSLHGPFLDLKPASPDLLIREVSYKRYLEILNIAAELDMDYIVFHSQINPQLNEPFIINLNNMQNKEFWEKILKETKYNGIILIENIFEESPYMLKEYIETMNLPNMKINLDIGHAKLGKSDLEEWLKELKDYIVYMHIHSNNGLYDQHKSPSKDEIENLYKLLAKYQINPILSLEYKTNNLEMEIKRYL